MQRSRVQVRRTIWRGVTDLPKGGCERTVDLPGSAVEALRAHRHLRGVFVPEKGGVRFEPLPPPTQGEVERLLKVVRHRVPRLLERRGALPAQGPEDALQAYQAHSLKQRLRWTDGAPSWRASPRTPIRTCMSTTGRDWSGYAATGHAVRWRWNVCHERRTAASPTA